MKFFRGHRLGVVGPGAIVRDVFFSRVLVGHDDLYMVLKIQAFGFIPSFTHFAGKIGKYIRLLSHLTRIGERGCRCLKSCKRVHFSTLFF